MRKQKPYQKCQKNVDCLRTDSTNISNHLALHHFPAWSSHLIYFSSIPVNSPNVEPLQYEQQSVPDKWQYEMIQYSRFS